MNSNRGRTVLVDPGPLYALTDPGDQYHQRAIDELAALEAMAFTTTVLPPTLMESYTLILRRLGIAVAHQWLVEVIAFASFLTLSEPDLASVMDLVLHFPDQQLTLFDALLAVTARRLDRPVWTYDHHFDVLDIDRWYRA